MAEKNEYDHDQEIANAKNEFFAEIKEYILATYEPVTKPDKDTLLFSTLEFYHAIQGLFPSNLYKTADVAIFLKSAGFKFTEISELRFMWMVTNKEKP
ncbi:hypothetical protein BH11BAC5_BH11BAC5_48660 [soil metagenome]